jgi:hypothetical protein
MIDFIAVTAFSEILRNRQEALGTARKLKLTMRGHKFSWLERLPVKQEVAGSSPVAPAKFSSFYSTCKMGVFRQTVLLMGWSAAVTINGGGVPMQLRRCGSLHDFV